MTTPHTHPDLPVESRFSDLVSQGQRQATSIVSMRTSDPDIKKQLRVRAHEPAKPQGSGGEKNGWTWDEKRREGGEKSTASCSSGADVFEPYYHKLCQETSADLPQWQSSNSAVCSSVPSAARIFFYPSNALFLSIFLSFSYPSLVFTV